MKKNAQRLFWNAMLLTAASLLIRTVSVGFQIYISNRAGAEAMGLFSLMGGVYGFALTLATSGIHLGVTRTVVDAIGREEKERIGTIMRRAVTYSLLFGIGAMLLLLCSAKAIGLHWLKDARTVRSLRLFGLTLPLIALSSTFNGYFTAVRRVYKNAVVQVSEQALKIGCTMLLLAGLADNSDIESTCCALVLGGALAETASFLIEMCLYLSDRRRNGETPTVANGREGRDLMQISLPIALTAYIRSGLLTLEHILIPQGLRSCGASHAAALVAYGSIQSMALPVVLYPAALISSFSGLLLPEVAEANVRRHRRHIQYMVSRVWFLSMVFAIGVAGVLLCFSEGVGQALYPATQTGAFIRMLAPLIPIMYVDTATDAMLKGLGEQVYSMKVNIADAAISVLLVYLLIPKMGILGYVFTIYFSECFNTVCSITKLLLITDTPVHLGKWVYKPLLSVVGATTAGHLALRAISPYWVGDRYAVFAYIVGVFLLYLLLLRLMGGIEKADVDWVRAFFKHEKRARGAKEAEQDGRRAATAAKTTAPACTYKKSR